METNRSNLANEDIARKRIVQESADKRYTADSNLAGTIYSADRGYRGKVDTAYINEYGVNPTDVVSAGKGVVDTVAKVGKQILPTKVGRTSVAMVGATKNPTSVPKVAVNTALSATFKALSGKKTVKKPLSNSNKKRRK
nr:putative ORF1 [Marmot picobirnavirus]